MRIKLNQIQCKHCKDLLVSEHVHDFKMCSCDKVGVDGGLEYLRRIGNEDDYISLSILTITEKEFADLRAKHIN